MHKHKHKIFPKSKAHILHTYTRPHCLKSKTLLLLDWAWKHADILQIWHGEKEWPNLTFVIL